MNSLYKHTQQFCCYSWNSNGMVTLVVNETCLGLYRYFYSTVHKMCNSDELGPIFAYPTHFHRNTWGKAQTLSVLKSQSWREMKPKY